MKNSLPRKRKLTSERKQERLKKSRKKTLRRLAFKKIKYRHLLPTSEPMRLTLAQQPKLSMDNFLDSKEKKKITTVEREEVVVTEAAEEEEEEERELVASQLVEEVADKET